MVLPDNCLFEDKAGEVFEILMQDCACIQSYVCRAEPSLPTARA